MPSDNYYRTLTFDDIVSNYNTPIATMNKTKKKAVNPEMIEGKHWHKHGEAEQAKHYYRVPQKPKFARVKSEDFSDPARYGNLWVEYAPDPLKPKAIVKNYFGTRAEVYQTVWVFPCDKDLWICNAFGSRIKVGNPVPTWMTNPRPRSAYDVCSDCSACLSREQFKSFKVDGTSKLYCEACAAQFGTCRFCDKSFPTSTLCEYLQDTSREAATHSTERYLCCSRCRDDNAWNCSACHVYQSNNNRQTNARSGRICLTCVNSGAYEPCSACHNQLLVGERVIDEDIVMCRRCIEQGNEPRLIQPYSYRPNPIFNGVSGLTHYGIELEVDVNDQRRDSRKVLKALGGPTHTYLKSDSSIAHGFEIVTHPHTYDAHKALWTDAFFDLPGIDASKNGLHIHVERKNLKSMQIQKMVVFVNREPNKNFIVSIAGRNAQRWAAIDPNKKLTSKPQQLIRYEAINLEPRQTIEFRVFKGFTNKERFFSCLEFVDALVNFTSTCSIKDLDHESYCLYVRSKRSLYPNLDSFLVKENYLPQSQESWKKDKYFLAKSDKDAALARDLANKDLKQKILKKRISKKLETITASPPSIPATISAGVSTFTAVAPADSAWLRDNGFASDFSYDRNCSCAHCSAYRRLWINGESEIPETHFETAF